MRVRQMIGACLVATVSASCSLGDPEDASDINVYLDVDKATLPIGESMVITVTARNVGFDNLTLTGPSDCLLLVEVLSTQGGAPVWSTSGACTGSIVTEEIAPGQDKVQQFTWDGSNLAGARLASGFYLIRGIARRPEGAYVGPPRSVALE